MLHGDPRTSTMATWPGSPVGSILGKGKKGQQSLDLLGPLVLLLALCLPVPHLPFSGPQREGSSQLGPLEAVDLLICTLLVHIFMWAGKTDGFIQVAENPDGYCCTRMT